MRDVRDELTDEHREALEKAPNADGDAVVEIRLADRQDAEGVARCFFHAYGASYDHDWAYQPEAISDRWERGLMISAVATNPEADVVGHLGLDFARPGAKVAESAHAVVDPRYRGHHLFESLKVFLKERAEEQGLYGLYSEATAAHPYSQRGNLAIGAHQTGYLIGFIPSGVDYKRISGDAATHRQTIALMYLRTNEEPERTSHVPEAFRGIAREIYQAGAFRRELGTGEGATRSSGTILNMETDHEHNAALISTQALGSDLHDVVRRGLAAVLETDVDCVYLDLPLSEPVVAKHGADLDDLGFFFGGIVPEALDDGDVLRLQLLNGVAPHTDEIVTVSDYGKTLLDDIVASMPGPRG